MNKYKLFITGTDSIGLSFIQNVIKYAGKGAVQDQTNNPFMKFPHSITMVIDTEEFLEDEIGVKVVPIDIHYSKEYLESLPIEEMRPLVAQKGVKGRDKVKMIKQYLAACESGKNDESSEEDE